MRKSLAALVVVAVVPATLALPVLAGTPPAPHPVAPHTVSRPLDGVDSRALASLQAATPGTAPLQARSAAAQATPAVLTGELATDPYQLVGVTWAGQAPSGLRVSVRVRDDATGWSGWQSLAVSDVGPDPGSLDARGQRGGTEPLVTGPSRGVQVRVDTTSGAVPSGLTLQLVDPGSSPADSAIAAPGPASQAQAAQSQPRIITRAAWGADERLRTNGFAGYSDTVKVGFVHHTTTPNSYTSTAQAAQQIRAIYAYDTQGLHWSDIAYNFLVDKWGNVYEGRAGGVALPVIGAHTAGFNDQSFAVSALGCFDTTCSGGGAAPSSAMLNGIAGVLAWKLGLFHRDPLGTETLVSSGITGTNIHHPAGERVAVRTISGHRDVDATACPGNRLYPYLNTIRSLALTKMQAGFADPRLSTGTVAYDAAGPSVLSGVIATQTWQADVADVCRGGVVASMNGSASRTVPIAAAMAGGISRSAPALPGPYSVTLTGRSATGLAVPWTTGFAVDAPPPDPEPAGSAVTGAGGFVPVAPQRLLDTRDGLYANGPRGRVDLDVLGRGGVPASGVTAVALTVTATCPTTGGYLSVAPTGTGTPPSSNLNLRGGQTRAALVIAAVGGGGRVSLRNSSGTTQMVVDVNGYFAASGGAEMTPVSLRRVYDSRGATTLGTGESRTITLPSLGGVAATDLVGVFADVGVYSPKGPGWLSVYPGGSAWPGTSSLNYAPGQEIDNSVVVKVSGGKLVVRNGGPPVDFSVDVTGVFTSHATLAGSRLEAVTPLRVLDTRAVGGGGPFAVNQVRAVTVAGGTTGVPADAKAVLVNLTGIARTATTSFVAWPDDGSPIAAGAFIRLGAGDVRANAAVVAVAPDGRILLRNVAGSTDLVIDVMGYFR